MFSGVFAKRRESYGAQDCLCREVNPYVIRPWNARRGMISEMSGVREEISGGYCGGVPPLPIPNREVKPTSADGTAMQCGRVGNRLLLKRVLRRKSWDSFFMPFFKRRQSSFFYCRTLRPFACVFVDCLFSIVVKSFYEALPSILFML